MSTQKHFFNLFLGTGLNVILGIITTPIITRIVAPEAYGNLSLFTLCANVFMIVALLGQDQAYARFFYTNDEEDYKRYVLKETSKMPLIIAAIAAIGGVCAYFILPGNKAVLLIFAVYLIFLTVGTFSNLVCRLKMRTTLYALIINVQKLIYVTLTVIAVLVLKWDHLIALTASTMLAQVIVCIIGISAEKNQWKHVRLPDEQEARYKEIVDRKALLAYGLPFIFANLCNWIFTGADKIMIKMFSTDVELGVYASAISVVGIFSIITTTFGTLWGPLAIERYEKNKEDTSFFIKASDYICVILFTAGAGLVLFKDLIVYLLGADYRTAVFLLPFLTLHPIMYSVSESMAYGINFAKKTNLHIVTAATCAAFNIIFNLFLIPAIGALGAAVATGITYTIFFVMRTRFSQKCFPVKYSFKKIAIVLVLYYIYIIYNSIFVIDLISVIMFIVFAAVLILLYRQCIKELLRMALDYVKGFIKKF